MDEKQFNLLVHLRKDSRKNLATIGRSIRTPISTLHDRMKRLREELVEKYTCIVNFKKMGFNCRAHVIIRLCNKEDRDILKEALLRHHGVNSLYKINNGYDFLAEVVFQDMFQLDTFVEQLDEKFKIKEKKIYYIVEDIAREVFLSDPVHAEFLREL